MKRRCMIAVVLTFAFFFMFPPALGEAWSQINQTIPKKAGWERIVQSSSFSLGESREVVMDQGKRFVEKAFGTYPSIDGSTVMVPMALEFARQHLDLSEADLTGFVAFSTTHNAYMNLIGRLPNGSATLITEEAVMDAAHPVDLMIGTEPSDEELALAKEAGVTLVKKPVCYDAFVFIVHAGNPVETLSLDEIRSIYRGEITDWGELGGDDEEIEAYQRNQNSGSQTAMENMVMQGEPMRTSQLPGIYFLSDMSALVERIGGYRNTKNGIGYTYKYYLDELYRDGSVKIIAIDGVYATDENLRSGAYPLTTNYYGVIRQGDEESAGGLFLDWMLSEEGQRCVRQAGYIPVLALDGKRAGDE